MMFYIRRWCLEMKFDLTPVFEGEGGGGGGYICGVLPSLLVFVERKFDFDVCRLSVSRHDIAEILQKVPLNTNP